MELPMDLRAAIDEELEHIPPKRLASQASELSSRYRGTAPPKDGKFLRSNEDATAYAAFRLPATFAAVYSALMQMSERLPGWFPQTLADIGAGPGTAMWAAVAVWQELREITLVERDEGMLALGKRLASKSQSFQIRQARWLRADVTGSWEIQSHDMVIASYMLGELSPNMSDTFIRELWRITGGALLLIEPGTPAGYARIRHARDLLMVEGAKSVAPCPHDNPCPMSADDWCHFSQRVERSKLHKHVKSGELSYEDEKFSFIVMSRVDAVPSQGRVIRHPQIRTGHIRLEACTPDGLTATTVSRKDREFFRLCKDLRWGSSMLCSTPKTMEHEVTKCD